MFLMLRGKHLLNSLPPHLAEVLQTKMLVRVLKPCRGCFAAVPPTPGARRVCSWALPAWSSSQLRHFPCPRPAGGTRARLRDQKMKLYSSVPHPDQSSPALYLPQRRTASAPGSAFILKICSLLFKLEWEEEWVSPRTPVMKRTWMNRLSPQFSSGCLAKSGIKTKNHQNSLEQKADQPKKQIALLLGQLHTDSEETGAFGGRNGPKTMSRKWGGCRQTGQEEDSRRT